MFPNLCQLFTGFGGFCLFLFSVTALTLLLPIPSYHFWVCSSSYFLVCLVIFLLLDTGHFEVF